MALEVPPVIRSRKSEKTKSDPNLLTTTVCYSKRTGHAFGMVSHPARSTFLFQTQRDMPKQLGFGPPKSFKTPKFSPIC